MQIMRADMSNELKNKVFNILQDTDGQTTEIILRANPAGLFLRDETSKNPKVLLFSRYGSARTNSLNIASQITTHYMEDNTARQDHWSLSPITYTMSGFIGELIYTPPQKWTNKVEEAIGNFAVFGMLSPTLNSYMNGAIAVVQQVENSVNRYTQIAQNSYNKLMGGGIIRQSNIEKVTEMITVLRNCRELVNIWTPFGNLNNYAIQNINITQQNIQHQTDIEIQFIEWKEIDTNIRQATDREKANFSKIQKAIEVQQQASTEDTTIKPQSMLYRILKGGK